MARSFDIPEFYKSSIISTLKQMRREQDQRKLDLAPAILDLGKLRFKIARHFGFCFGVENAIEIAYRAIRENPGKRVFLLSEMIHNAHVNQDLSDRGVRFLMDTDGTQRIPFDELCPEDIVIVPAFGTTVELFTELEKRGIDPRQYNATCPFVEKVWRRAAQLGEKGYTIVIHGKHTHEETRATFSHARLTGRSIVIRDMQEAECLASYIRGDRALENFTVDFAGRCSRRFNPATDLARIGVVNQTTMLAGETQAISRVLRAAIDERYGSVQLANHFADTRDTLCYATSENQQSIFSLLDSGGDLALVVGGYNSSNTSHLVELCEEKVPTYYIQDADEIQSIEKIRHLNFHEKRVLTTSCWYPQDRQVVEVLVSAGASCPDALVDQVVVKVAELVGVEKNIEDTLSSYREVLVRAS